MSSRTCPMSNGTNACSRENSSSCAALSSSGTAEQSAVRARSMPSRGSRSRRSGRARRAARIGREPRGCGRAPSPWRRPRWRSRRARRAPPVALRARVPSVAAHLAAKMNWRLAISAERRSAASRPGTGDAWRGCFARDVGVGGVRQLSIEAHHRLHQRQLALHRALEQRAGDEQAVDLVGALEDAVDARVAVGALDRVLLDEAVAAEDLHRLVDERSRAPRCRRPS